MTTHQGRRSFGGSIVIPRRVFGRVLAIGDPVIIESESARGIIRTRGLVVDLDAETATIDFDSELGAKPG